MALVVDASIIRAVLVPATMMLMGRANWWAPAPLRRLHERFGLGAGDDVNPPRSTTSPDRELVTS
jgi:uncharacterized membrane protein YdfJ with MMPL/SSD domain